MKKKVNLLKSAGVILLTAAIMWALAPRTGYAHCDTLDGPVVTAAKAALEKGDVTGVLKWVPKKEVAYSVQRADLNAERSTLNAERSAGIRQRFNHAMKAKKHAEESIAEGREYVKAYVEFVHYVEGLHKAVSNQAHTAENSHGAELGTTHTH